VTIGFLEDAQAAPRSEELGAGRLCGGGRGAGGGLNCGAEWRSRGIDGVYLRIGGTASWILMVEDGGVDGGDREVEDFDAWRSA